MKIEVPRIWVHGLGWGVHTCKKAGRILWWQTGSRVPKATLEFRSRTRVTQEWFCSWLWFITVKGHRLKSARS